MLWNMIYDWLVHIFGWNNFYVTQIRFFTNRIPRVVIAIAVIWIGCRLIRGKKIERIEEEEITGVRQDISDNKDTANMQDSVDEQTAPDSQDNTVEQ